jgi:hypothetical protein
MSIIDNFRKKKLTPTSVVLNLPEENPELQITFGVLNTLEINFIMTSLALDNIDFNNSLWMNVYYLKVLDKLSDKIVDYKVLTENEKLSKAQVKQLLLNLPMDDVFNLIGQYLIATTSTDEK